MAKSGSGGWSRRRKNGNSTVTYNTKTGSTYSYSVGGKSNRTTTSHLPGGKTKITRTIRNGDWVKRETRTFGGTTKLKKFKTPKIRKTRYRKGKQLSFSDLFFTIIFFFILIALFV
jgi:hypothetical protein